MKNNNKGKYFKAMASGFVVGLFVACWLSYKMSWHGRQWAREMREEIMHRVKETKDITQEKYNQIIDEISPRYEAMKNIGSRQINQLAEELRSHWENISQEAKRQMDMSKEKGNAMET